MAKFLINSVSFGLRPAQSTSQKFHSLIPVILTLFRDVLDWMWILNISVPKLLRGPTFGSPR
jgi:hypothetical protein